MYELVICSFAADFFYCFLYLNNQVIRAVKTTVDALINVCEHKSHIIAPVQLAINLTMMNVLVQVSTTFCNFSKHEMSNNEKSLALNQFIIRLLPGVSFED